MFWGFEYEYFRRIYFIIWYMVLILEVEDRVRVRFEV